MPTKELNEEEYLGGEENGRNDDEPNPGGPHKGKKPIVTDGTFWGKDADPKTGREQNSIEDKKEKERKYSDQEKREAQSDYDQSAFSQNLSNKDFRVDEH